MYRTKKRNRGVVLLLVLGVLAMFGLIGITFVLLAGQARRGAASQAKVGQADNPPPRIADDVIKQILRGSNNQESVIGPHGLLEDLYGNETVEGAITGSVTPIVGGQLTALQTNLADPYKHVGCVLTFTSGNAKGKSTRIVGYDQANAAIQIVCSDPSLTLTATDTFIVNGTPFSGTGFGYNPNVPANPTDPLLTAEESTYPYALSPNPRMFTANAAYSYTDPAGPGGANEDYDAADYQNMLLACVVPQAGPPPTVKVPIPSLHRPELVNYWFRELDSDTNLTNWSSLPATDKLAAFLNPYGADNVRGNADDPLPTTDSDYIVALKRRIILRPLKEDHPNFTGSNPTATATVPDVFGIYDNTANNIPDFLENGSGVPSPWDVDNDGDGVMDSIWVDVGLPVRSTRDGRLYKPLAAILCVDLDGRLNLNAHGCLAQAQVEAIGGLLTGSGYVYTDPANATASIIAGSATTANVVRGQGVGPAEINLRALFDTTTAQANNVCSRLFCGYAANQIEGRYGELTSATPASPGITQSTEALSFNLKLDRPTDSTDLCSSYGTPVDFKGTQAVCLDLRGQPLYENLTEQTAPDRSIIDDPYELNLSKNAAHALNGPSLIDNPYSVAELEAMLRPFDVDSIMLPARLPRLMQRTNTTDATTGLEPLDIQNLRNLVTTESWSLPCPAVSLRINKTGGSTVISHVKHIAEIIDKKLEDGGVTAANRPQAIYDLLSPDLRAGLRMDINRVFGDGNDNNSNDVVDEPGEYDSEFLQQVNASGTAAFTTTKLDLNNDGVFDAKDEQSRQLFARHLYVLAMAIVDVEGIKSSLGINDTDAARMIAQWAVNVVDFRDRDSIMTGFEFDPDPFDGWDVDGDLSTDEDTDPANLPNEYVVWGCERPELLITETLAFHDRRTEDRKDDDNVKEYTSAHDPPGTDPTYDQRILPEGSLFIELYNPWSENESLPAELYTIKNGHIGIELEAKDKKDNDSPVWRMIIVDPNVSSGDPDDPTLRSPVTVERSIYFVEPGSNFQTLLAGGEDGERYYPNPANLPAIAVLKPGRYAVVGPGSELGANNTGKYITYIGFRSGITPTTPVKDYIVADTRRIELTPSVDPEATQVQVYGDGTSPDLDLTTLNINEPIAIVINPPDFAANQPKRMSVSEKVGGYDPYTDTTNRIYSTPLDTPADVGGIPASLVNGTTLRHRWIYLQRLANPLIPYDPDTNPYRVVDKAQIDLTAFNGMGNDSADANITPGTSGIFFTRERGEDEEDPTAEKKKDIWSVEIPTDPTYPPKVMAGHEKTVSNHNFTEVFSHTLGYLNEGFGDPIADPNNPTSKLYNGAPQTPFPWLTWLNRPFISSKELMLVPGCRSSQLLQLFSLDVNEKPYVATPPADPKNFGHLPNFFQSTDGTSHAAGLHRLLEFVHVPSPFVGTQLQGNPQYFSGGTNHSFNAPFNYVSNYRDPGKVNINTITSDNVWKGIINDLHATSPRNDMPVLNDIVNSRRGYNTGTPGSMFVMNDNYPTRFANPFRSSMGLYLVPTPDLKNNIVKTEANATMLRADGVPESFDETTAEDCLLKLTNSSDFNAIDSNPYFRYQPLHRLDNLLTTQSNVYAVWVTVGYFEVSPAPAGYSPAIYPDGYQLGQELGSDSGDVTRNRAFYIIDRSLPVGFKRGEDLNVEDAILLRREIE